MGVYSSSVRLRSALQGYKSVYLKKAVNSGNSNEPDATTSFEISIRVCESLKVSSTRVGFRG